jgi:hypothetical protein
MKDKGKNVEVEIAKGGNSISRKEAIKKVGYAAFSAATMMLLLNDPARAASHSPVLPPDWGDGDGWG